MSKEAKSDPSNAVLSCNLTAMDPAQRKRYEALKGQLRAATKETKELPNGYAFRYDGESTLILTVAEFITLEKQCCSFYTFALEVTGNDGPVWLRITGPGESKFFIRDALTND